MDLIIVESPTKAKTIESYAGKGFKVISSKGHIIDLPEKSLGIEPEKDFAADFREIPAKKKIIQSIKELSAQSEKIYIATDPDREGEAIAYHISTILDKSKTAKRVLFYEITKKGIKSGLDNPIEIDRKRVESQYSRRILDRIVGYKVSPFLWKSVKKGLSAGRVQSVALRLICEREDKIDKFASKTFFKIKGFFEKKKIDFTAELIEHNGKKTVIESQKEADEIKADIMKSEYSIADFKNEEKTQRPQPPFITSTLQQAASNALNYSARKTMQVAQDLYEGVVIDGAPTGLITYMRTDSTRLSEDAVRDIRSHISENFSKEYLPSGPNVFKNSNTSQDAHEAIRPADISLTPERAESFLTRDQLRLYTLIWKRAVASQMADARYSFTTVDIRGGEYLFRGVGNRLLFDGFFSVYTFGDRRELKNLIPELKKGEGVDLTDCEIKEEKTSPPARFSEATLVKMLEQKGIGRPSTYASIIDIIQRRGYVSKEKRYLKPTELGRLVNKILVEYFSEIVNVGFTAEMEKDLDLIEEGSMQRIELLKTFYSEFEKTLKNAEANKSKIKSSVEEKTEEVCEKCGSPMIIKWGRYGKFLACSNYPACSNTKQIAEETETIDKACPKCGKPLIIKNGRFGRFVACSDYPKCKYTSSFTLGIKCPECEDGEIVEKQTKKGRKFYACSNYPKCKFSMWKKPVKKVCKNCGYEGMEEKSGQLICIKCKHEDSEESSE